MQLKELLAKINRNDPITITIYDDETGEVFFRSTWIETISDDYLDKDVQHVQILKYEMRLGILWEK